MPSNHTEILKHDLSDPERGFFAVRLCKGGLERAVGVVYGRDGWTVFLDGERLAAPSHNWQDAFGALLKQSFLAGRKLERGEYMRLINLRLSDIAAGIDVTKPFKL